jgi:hypothetical protein
MASLQVAHFAGVVPDPLGGSIPIPDGAPRAAKIVVGGTSDSVFGTSDVPVICDLTPIGGDATVTWPGGIVEIITGPTTRRLRGETVSVA